jgi:hypothetical protein
VLISFFGNFGIRGRSDLAQIAVPRELPGPLILRRPFDVVDDEEVDGGVGRFELEAELGFEGFAECGGIVGDGFIPGGVVHPAQGEVVESGEAGLIDDRARHGRESGHGGDRSGEEGKSNGAAAEVLAGCGGRNVRQDAAGGGKIANGRRGGLRLEWRGGLVPLSRPPSQ